VTKPPATVLIAALILTAACTPPTPPSILLFNGAGTSPGDVAALENLLRRHHFPYATVDTPALNAMTDSSLRQYKLLIIPGGNFEAMGKELTPAALATIRGSVHNGLNYLGICAGAFLAGNPRSHGFNLTGGITFPFYSAEAQGIRKAPLWIATPGEPPLQHYWEDGPALTDWGDVVARYPDQTPAVVQATAGKGWVILTGIHPEAPESWRRGMSFSTPASLDNAYAKKLIDAALNRTPLPHF
jgi:glutamine amidotransferase-like uncharacterized protein